MVSPTRYVTARGVTLKAGRTLGPGMELGLTDSVALVTAGSRGLGRASALALAREGADVAVCARNAERLEAARRDINDAAAGDVLAVQADITDPDDVDALLSEVTDDLGGLDHLVVSTGRPADGPFAAATERDWYVGYDLLVMSLVWLARRAGPFLADGGGSLTAIASTEAREPVAGRVISSTVRRAVPGLVKTLAREWAPAVRVNAVLPGPHDTPGLHDRVEAATAAGRYESVESGVEQLRGAVPLGRLGDPAALGDLVAVLASDRAGFVTGACVPVDGGTLRG